MGITKSPHNTTKIHQIDCARDRNQQTYNTEPKNNQPPTMVLLLYCHEQILGTQHLQIPKHPIFLNKKLRNKSAFLFHQDSPPLQNPEQMGIIKPPQSPLPKN
jgi:hypothetical protein